ncbi:3-demethylubiquinone-9 3-methyltransferase [Nostocoides australiense Ben110]|uniref:3-demethylubiquinone-9 3-methyltransferase n=1 Tax=Nostocoides australiense Ben110 TaxID=1193182 RepID=W6JXQ8_9MICO|nr:VOC family protein [Tetrasphaera australiensis]CCH74353.1 3-demethylubiquinone-9 3-methyltransferase [Tetrasphaera australiensis Ben110]
MSTTTNAARYQTCLWFDTDGLEAAEHDTSLLPDAEITGVSRYPDDVDKGTPGAVMQVHFRLGDQRYVALNGGPQFPHSETVSLQVYVETQEDLDRIWTGLLAGGEETMCGWLRDRFGLSWQVIPTRLGELLADSEPVGRVVRQLQAMTKLDIAPLEAAYNG